MRRIDQINVIPFIDIMLVLLAIVLTTATFMVRGQIEVRLPQAENTTASPPKSSVELLIDAAQAIYLDDQPIEIEALRQRLHTVPKDTPIVMRVDERVPFARFVAVVDLLKANRLERLSILARKAP